jgi:signal transduction histidine kinase
MPLRARLALLFSIATAVAITSAGALFVYQLGDNLYDTLDAELRERLAATSARLADSGVPGVIGPGAELTQIRDLTGRVLIETPHAAGLTLSPGRLRRALAGTEFFTSSVGSTRFRVLAAAVPVGTSRLLVLVGAGTDIADDAVERVRTALLVMGPMAVVLAGLAASILAAAALRPVEQMRAEAAAIGAHEPERRLAVPSTRDEIAALGRTINELLDRLHHALERERRFVADASHELRTPLAILRAELELAERPGRSQRELQTAVADARGETVRLSNLVEDLLLLARADNQQRILRPEPVELATLLARATDRGRAKDREPAVDVHCPPGLTVTLDPERILQALTNLLDNAIGHSPPGTPVALRAERDEAGGVTIEVLDAGPGVPPEFLSRAFERFQRVEEDRARDTGGTGLGLSIVRAVVQAHGGTVGIANRPEGGTRVTMRFRGGHPAGGPVNSGQESAGTSAPFGCSG